ncbi:hypothetical protein B0H13DRAFT_1903178 [Mycena leptocephala]|nr:hypothetical protein B0H13DRAFT_1903178 [Mycena leptocephala]
MPGMPKQMPKQAVQSRDDTYRQKKVPEVPIWESKCVKYRIPRWPEGPRIREVRRSEDKKDKSSGTDRARTVVSTIRCRNGLWLQLMRCALHYARSPISERRSKESLFIVIYKTKGDIIISVENKLPEHPENDVSQQAYGKAVKNTMLSRKTSCPQTATTVLHSHRKSIPMAPKDTGKGLNESVAEFHERLVQMSGEDAEQLSEDNQHLRINLRKAKREAEEKWIQEEEAQRLREATEKKREDDEKRQKEAEKARKKAEKGKEKKKWDRDGVVVSDEGEMDAPKRKKPKVGEYDPKCERREKSGVPCFPQAQGCSHACEACSKAKAKCSLSNGDSAARLSVLAGAFQGLSDSVEEFLVEQRAQWEWERKERGVPQRASAGALQHMARIMEAFVRRSSPDFMTSMPAGPPELGCDTGGTAGVTLSHRTRDP